MLVTKYRAATLVLASYAIADRHLDVKAKGNVTVTLVAEDVPTPPWLYSKDIWTYYPTGT